MKFTCDKGKLSAAIKTARSAIQGKVALPLLHCLLVETIEQDLVRVSGTSIETTVAATLPATVTQPGSACLPAATLSRAVIALPDGEASFSTKGSSVTVRRNKTRYSLLAVDPGDFPSHHKIPETIGVHMPQSQLRAMLRRAAPAIAGSEETRRILQGMHMTMRDGSLTVTTTDGRRLARAQSAVRMLTDVSFVIPKTSVKVLQKELGDTSETVSVVQDNGNVYFCLGDTTVASQLLDGRFPNADNLLPKKFTIEVRVDRGTFAAALRRVLVIPEDSISPNLVRLDIRGDEMLVTTTSPQSGNAEDAVPVTKSGPDIEVSFNGKFLLAGLAIGDDDLVLRMNDSASACVVQGVGSEDLYLIMPVRTQNNERMAA